MSEKLKVQNNLVFRGYTYPLTAEIVTDGVVIKSPEITAAPKAGSLTTRTDDDTGVAALSTGHGLTTGDKVDVYWAGGSRRQMAATVSTNNITVDGGNGDALPTALTAVTLVKNVGESISIIGDDMEALLLYSPVRAAITFLDGSNTILYSVELQADQTFSWLLTSGITNPLAGDTVASMRISHVSTTAQVVEAMAFVN